MESSHRSAQEVLARFRSACDDCMIHSPNYMPFPVSLRCCQQMHMRLLGCSCSAVLRLYRLHRVYSLHWRPARSWNVGTHNPLVASAVRLLSYESQPTRTPHMRSRLSRAADACRVLLVLRGTTHYTVWSGYIKWKQGYGLDTDMIRTGLEAKRTREDMRWDCRVEGELNVQLGRSRRHSLMLVSAA